MKKDLFSGLSKKNFDLKKFSQDEKESILNLYKKVKKYNPYHLKNNPRYVGRK